MQPSAILIRSDTPKDVGFYAVVSFRNSVAVAAIIKGADSPILKGDRRRPLWSDFFDFYPFTARTDGRLAGRKVLPARRSLALLTSSASVRLTYRGLTP